MLVLVGGVIVGFGCPWLGGSDDGDISVDGVGVGGGWLYRWRWYWSISRLLFHY